MPRILCIYGNPIGVIEFLPNNGLGSFPLSAEAELCHRVSPDEGEADIVDVTDEELEALRRGEIVEKVLRSGGGVGDGDDCGVFTDYSGPDK